MAPQAQQVLVGEAVEEFLGHLDPVGHLDQQVLV